MNSRGKKLSQFDKIKSEIDKILPDDIQDYDSEFSLYEKEDSYLKERQERHECPTFADKW